MDVFSSRADDLVPVAVRCANSSLDPKATNLLFAERFLCGRERVGANCRLLFFMATVLRVDARYDCD